MATLERPPRHIILNLTPLHVLDNGGQDYFSLQSNGTAFCPYRIVAYVPFLEGFTRLATKSPTVGKTPTSVATSPSSPSIQSMCITGFICGGGECQAVGAPWRKLGSCRNFEGSTGREYR